jgi:Protein of unknown function (DUF3108)
MQAPKRVGLHRPARGLLLAVVISVLAHSLLFVKPFGLFSFPYKSEPGAQSLNTRMLEVPASPRLEPAAQKPPLPPPPKQKPAVPRVEKSATLTPAPATSPPAQATPEPAPVLLPTSEPPPLASTAEPSTSSETSPTTTPASTVITTNNTDVTSPGAPAALKLQYPSNAEMEFKVTRQSKGSTQTGAGLLQWKSDGAGYELSIESSAFGVVLISQKSMGIMSPMGLTPERFSDKRALRPERATHFRRDTGKIQFSNNKPDAELLAGAQDRLSILLQIAGILGGDPERYKIVNRIGMQVAGSDSAETWEFSIDGLQDISLPAANMQTLKLTRKPRDEFDQRMEVWLAPQLGYLPVRIRQSALTEPEANYFDLSLQRIP